MEAETEVDDLTAIVRQVTGAHPPTPGRPQLDLRVPLHLVRQPSPFASRACHPSVYRGGGNDSTTAQLHHDVTRDAFCINGHDWVGAVAGAPAIVAAVVERVRGGDPACDGDVAVADCVLRIATRTVSGGDALEAALRLFTPSTTAIDTAFREALLARAQAARASALVHALTVPAAATATRLPPPPLLPWAWRRTPVPEEVMATVPRALAHRVAALSRAAAKLRADDAVAPAASSRDGHVTLVPQSAAALPVRLDIAHAPPPAAGGCVYAAEVAACLAHWMRQGVDKGVDGHGAELTMADVAAHAPTSPLLRSPFQPTPLLQRLAGWRSGLATHGDGAGGLGAIALIRRCFPALVEALPPWPPGSVRTCTVEATTVCNLVSFRDSDDDDGAGGEGTMLGTLTTTFHQTLAWPDAHAWATLWCGDATSDAMAGGADSSGGVDGDGGSPQSVSRWRTALATAALACGFDSCDVPRVVDTMAPAHVGVIFAVLAEQCGGGNGWRVWETAPQVLKHVPLVAVADGGSIHIRCAHHHSSG